MQAHTRPPLRAAGDAVVVGSGAAGSGVAIATARNGATGVLVEMWPLLGATSTATLTVIERA